MLTRQFSVFVSYCDKWCTLKFILISFLGHTHLYCFILNLMDWRCVWMHAVSAMKRGSSVAPARLIPK